MSKAPDQVSVPDVTGQTGDAAKSFLEAEPYTFQVTVQTEPSTDVPANNVVRTDPAVNTPIAKGSNVTLVVSAGPAKVKVPPVEGLTEEAARNQLTTRGLVAEVQFVTVASGSADDGHVISQSIPPTESVAPGTTIRLKVGKVAVAPSTTTTTTIPPTTTTTIPPVADLAITKTDGSTTKSPGTVTYTIVASNAAGPADINAVHVTDKMPKELTNVTWTCAAKGGASCPASGSGDGDIDVTVNLPVGGTVTFTVTSTLTATSGKLENTAKIAPPNGATDPQPDNNSATDSDNITL